MADGDPEVDPVVAALRMHRVARGLTQAQVAAAVGSSRSSVALWETGQSDPPLRKVRAYAAAVGLVLVPVPVEFMGAAG
jgi:transcriptional regulator with XRE-family HTH domain